MAISFRDQAALANFADFSTGILDTVLNVFYKRDENGDPDPDWSNIQYLPHHSERGVSLRGVMGGWNWPSNFVEEALYPEDEATEYSDNLQGHTVLPAEAWIITNTDSDRHPRVYEIPLSEDLAGSGDLHYAGLGPDYETDYNHMGAPSHLGDEAFIPVEYDETLINRVFTFSGGALNLQRLRAGFVPKNNASRNGCSLVIVNPINRVFYCGWFQAQGSTYALQVYDETSVEDDALDNEWDFLGSLLLFDEHGDSVQSYRTQGGCWTDNGHIYLINDIDPESSGPTYGLAGITGYDVVSGRRMFHHEMDYSNSNPEPPPYHHEIQDICIFDVDTLPYPVPGVEGQVHVMALNNDVTTDQFDGFHFSVSAEDKEYL